MFTLVRQAVSRGDTVCPDHARLRSHTSRQAVAKLHAGVDQAVGEADPSGRAADVTDTSGPMAERGSAGHWSAVAVMPGHRAAGAIAVTAGDAA
ncbi:hypothetical protein [Amycolatopsis sp. NPDC049868]|uniref:hypothetical protein n=1 Tax=Amycolatopsis sp. NPDC049868 TaxID=3363934 RepID=UPI0037AED7B2